MQDPKYDMTTYTFNQQNNSTPPSTTSGYANEFTIQLPQPLNLIKSKLCLKDIFCYNAFPNIRQAWGNNTFSYLVPNKINADVTIPDDYTEYKITNKSGLTYIEDGMYNADVLNKLLKFNFDKNGHYWIDSSGRRHYPIELSVNTASYRTHFVFNRLQGALPAGWHYPLTGLHRFALPTGDPPTQPAGTQTVVANTWVWLYIPGSPYLAGEPSRGISSIQRILGINAAYSPPFAINNTTTLPSVDGLIDDAIRMDGQYPPTVVEQNVIQVSCNLVNNPNVGSSLQNVIYSFSPTVAVGSLNIEKPFHNFIPCTDGNYNEIKIRLTDTFGQPMPLIDDQFVATLILHRPIEELKSEYYKRSRIS